jgi:hypothetical protein
MGHGFGDIRVIRVSYLRHLQHPLKVFFSAQIAHYGTNMSQHIEITIQVRT